MDDHPGFSGKRKLERTTAEQHTGCGPRLDRTAATLAFLDPGERAAIPLALSVRADRLLIDKLARRAEATQRRLRVTATLGVLIDVHWAGLLDFEQALAAPANQFIYISRKKSSLSARRESSSGDKS